MAKKLKKAWARKFVREKEVDENRRVDQQHTGQGSLSGQSGVEGNV